MSDLLLLRYGELGLKGHNRSFFIKKLKENIWKILDGKGQLTSVHGRLFFHPDGNEKEAVEKLQRVFGLVGISPAREVYLDMEEIAAAAEDLISRLNLETPTTFKVETRRANKSFYLDSMEINRDIGEKLLETFPRLKVDVHQPQLRVRVEIRNKAFVYLDDKPGPGGLPVGTGGRGILMLSGGIDSPVAGWMMLKRGLDVLPMHFSSHPYTNERSLEKVKELTRVLQKWGLKRPLYNVNFTPIQEELIQEVPADYLTILMRRMMVRLANIQAGKSGEKSIITGESLGQVASQTIESLHTTGVLAEFPILRPLIGLDKQEIITRAKEIGTYDISIEPFEDCCQVFVPTQPVTRPALSDIEKIEENLDLEQKLIEAIEKAEKL